MVQNLKWDTAHLSRRLGAGARWRGRWGTGLGAGQEGVWQALGVRGREGRCCRQLGARAQGAVGVRSWRVRAGGASGRLGERQQARGARQQARRGARQEQAEARGAAGWAAGAHLGVLNWARLGFCAP